MKRFVMGDIHGRKEALLQVIEWSRIDKENDLLIVLGDVVDGGYNTYECVEILLEFKNLIYIMGNHDEFFLDGISSGWARNIWLLQGGVNTVNSYGGKIKVEGGVMDNSPWLKEVTIPVTHQNFFNNAKYYYEIDKMIFVHGGFDPSVGPKKSSKQTLTWDRRLIEYAREAPQKPWKKIFVGHTTTQTYGDATVPLKFNNLWMLDTGAGWTGKLTIMDIDTEEYWQSDIQEPAGR